VRIKRYEFDYSGFKSVAGWGWS